MDQTPHWRGIIEVEPSPRKELTLSCGFKVSQLGAFCPKATVYCYLEFELRFLKNLKLFSIKIKELFESIVCENNNNNGSSGVTGGGRG